jgi:hypothetical protein
VAQRPGERVEVRRDLVGGDVGDDEPHAAAHVVADGLRHHEAMALGDRADRDAGAAVQIGGQDHARQPPRRVAPERRDGAALLALPEIVERVLEPCEIDSLDDGVVLDRHACAGEERHGDAIGMIDAERAVVHADDALADASAAGHGKPAAARAVETTGRGRTRAKDSRSAAHRRPGSGRRASGSGWTRQQQNRVAGHSTDRRAAVNGFVAAVTPCRHRGPVRGVHAPEPAAVAVARNACAHPICIQTVS